MNERLQQIDDEFKHLERLSEHYSAIKDTAGIRRCVKRTLQLMNERKQILAYLAIEKEKEHGTHHA